MKLSDMPESMEAERAVIGSVFLVPSLVDQVVTIPLEAFAGERNRLLAQSFARIKAAGGTVDLRTVQDDMERAGTWAGVGIGYIGGLDDDLPNVNRLKSYIEILQDRLARRRLIATAFDIGRRARVDGDPVGAIISDVRDRLAKIETAAVSGVYGHLGNSVRETLEELAKPRPNGMVGWRTGIPKLDHLTLGLCRGKLYVLAGRTGMGKTAMALQIAQQVAFDGVGVAYASPEMGGDELSARQLAHRARVSHQRIRKGMLSRVERARIAEAAEELERLPFYVDDRAVITISDFAARTRQLRESCPHLGVAIFDHLQIATREHRAESRHLELAEMTRALKAMAKDQALAVIVLSQLSRSKVTPFPEPALEDLRESGAIEQDADGVIFVHRPSYKSTDGMVILAKHRGGETGKVPVKWNGEVQLFAEVAAQADDEDEG